MKAILALVTLIIPSFVIAHKEPTTPEEIEVQRSLQAAAYYVRYSFFTYPFFDFLTDIQSVLQRCMLSFFVKTNITLLFITCSEQFTAQRKRSWAQSILAGRPALAGYEDLFDPAVYRDLSVSEQGAGVQKLLSCVEESSTEIRNNTCVLGMSSFFFLFFA